MDILEAKKVKTRKKHICWGCNKTFPKGTKMSFVKAVDSGCITAVYWCDPCNKFTNLIPSWEGEDGYLPGEIAELKEYYPEEWKKTHPEQQHLSQKEGYKYE